MWKKMIVILIMEKEMNKFIFLPDTNVLFNFAGALNRSSNNNDYREKICFDFIKIYGKEIKIPNLIWTEFCGLWFHKNIDLINYSLWFRNRLTTFNEVYRKLKEFKATLCDETNISFHDVFSNADVLTRTEVHQKLLNIITGRIKETINNLNVRLEKNPGDEKMKSDIMRNKNNLTNGKILDGLDSFIVGFAYEFAKINTEHEIYIVSEDKFLVETVNFFYDNEIENYGSITIPKNVAAYTAQNLLKNR